MVKYYEFYSLDEFLGQSVIHNPTSLFSLLIPSSTTIYFINYNITYWQSLLDVYTELKIEIQNRYSTTGPTWTALSTKVTVSVTCSLFSAFSPKSNRSSHSFINWATLWYTWLRPETIVELNKHKKYALLYKNEIKRYNFENISNNNYTLRRWSLVLLRRRRKWFVIEQGVQQPIIEDLPLTRS